MISLTNLTKRYGDVTAVDDVTLDIRPGVVTGFIGPNGAGKSTTLRLILGLDAPSAGTALVDGVPFRELPYPARTVGAHLDGRAAHPGRSAASHLLGLARHIGQTRARVSEVLELTGLSSVARRRVGTFSLGMSQRLGIAGALLGDPRVVLLDEPVNGLDVDGIRWIRGLLRQLADGGRTVLVSSHLLDELERAADRVVVLGRGKLLADCPTADLVGTSASLEEAYVRLVADHTDYRADVQGRRR